MSALPAVPLPTLGVEHTFDRVAWDEDIVKQALRSGAFLAAGYVKGLWQMRAQSLGLRDKGSGSYVGGIKVDGNVEVTDVQDLGEWRYEVTIEVRNAVPHAKFVEDGRSAFHLPSRVDWSKVGGSIKQGKNGPYLHIPFKHSAYASPAQREAKGYTREAIRRMMPKHVYEQARQLRRSVRRNVGPIFRFQQRRVDGPKPGPWSKAQIRTGPAARREAINAWQGRKVERRTQGTETRAQFVQADRYTWGDRLQRPKRAPMIQLGGPGASPGTEGFQERRSAREVPGSGTNPAWASSKWQGMFRSGPRGHSQYTTIRTMTPHSKGWHIPAQVGKGIARQVGTFLASDDRVVQLLQTGIDECLQTLAEPGV